MEAASYVRASLRASGNSSNSNRFMFKYVSGPRPQFMMLCDDPTCGVIARMEVPPDEDKDAVRQAFCNEAIRAHWDMELERQLCPAHSAKKEQREAAQKLIMVAAAMPGVLNRR